MPDIVNGILMQDQQVLLAHRAPTRRTYPDTWSFPGGHVETGETLDQALKRELREELGINVEKWSFLQRFDDPKKPEDRRVTFYLYLVTGWDGSPRNLGAEHAELKWMSLQDAGQMPRLAFASYADIFRALKGAFDNTPKAG